MLMIAELEAAGLQQSAAVLAGIPLPAMLVGPDDRILGMNDPAAEWLGAAALGRHHAMALRSPQVQVALNDALRDGLSGTARHLAVGSSQDSVHRITVTAIALPDDGRFAALLVAEDLSSAEQVEQMRRDFVANVSHELRSPLTALSGFIETLKGPARDDAAARIRFLDIMEREALRMNRLIRDLLHLSRVEAEERVRPKAHVDLLGVLHANLASLRPLCQAAGVDMRIDQQEGAPHIVTGDSDQLTQVFQNLIENAVKYGGSGGRVDIVLKADLLLGKPCLRVDIRDYGEGIDAKHLPRLTERFYRVDSHRSREAGGTGLGLAIVKHIIQRHRGRIQIASVKGEGSTFSVMLPLP